MGALLSADRASGERARLDGWYRQPRAGVEQELPLHGNGEHLARLCNQPLYCSFCLEVCLRHVAEPTPPLGAQDSGGECGVPYNAHFPFASQDPSSSTPFEERQPWYAFTYGNAAFVQMSTEHDFAANSTQHAWLRRALAAVDRRVTPWLVFSGHRPMYIESGWAGDAQTGEMIRAAVEPLLSEFSVDVAIWGHYHAYESFCPGLLHGKCGKAHGVQHFIIGTGGYDHSRCPAKTTKPMTLCNDETWGYMRMSFLNQSSAKFEFVAGDSGKVLDTTGIDRPRRLGG